MQMLNRSNDTEASTDSTAATDSTADHLTTSTAEGEGEPGELLGPPDGCPDPKNCRESQSIAQTPTLVDGQSPRRAA